jgi:enediyne biosynthesis protein E5
LSAFVLSRTKRTDVANTFLVTYIAILLGHAFYLGDPLSIPLKQMQSEALFTFFMITDPNTTQAQRPDAVCLPRRLPQQLSSWHRTMRIS